MKNLALAVVVRGVALTSFADAAVKNVVLVHGAFADGPGWIPVASILEHDGQTVFVAPEPLTGLE